MCIYIKPNSKPIAGVTSFIVYIGQFVHISYYRLSFLFLERLQDFMQYPPILHAEILLIPQVHSEPPPWNESLFLHLSCCIYLHFCHICALSSQLLVPHLLPFTRF